MDSFLSSFDDTVTLQTSTDETHRGVEFTQGSQANTRMTSKISNKPLSSLNSDEAKLWQDYQKNGYVYLGNVLDPNQLSKLQTDINKILGAVSKGENKFYG
jgi:hypothetical protein